MLFLFSFILFDFWLLGLLPPGHLPLGTSLEDLCPKDRYPRGLLLIFCVRNSLGKVCVYRTWGSEQQSSVVYKTSQIKVMEYGPGNFQLEYYYFDLWMIRRSLLSLLQNYICTDCFLLRCPNLSIGSDSPYITTLMNAR